MNVYEIISEKQDLEEAPAGVFKQMGRRVGAKVAGAVGAKGTAAGLTGAADTGKEANELKVALKGYAGKTGKNLKQLDAADLSAFLKSKGYPDSSMQGVTGIVTPKQIDDIMLKSVQAKHTAAGGSVNKAATTATPGSAGGGSAGGGSVGGGGASGDAGQAPGKAQNFVNKLQSKVSGKDATSTQAGNTTQQSANKDATSTQAGNTTQQSDDGKVIPMKQKGGGIPPEIQKQLDSLNKTEKQAVLGALK